MYAFRTNFSVHRGLAALVGAISILSTACQSTTATPSATTPSAANGLPAHGRIVFQVEFGPTRAGSNIATIEPDGTGVRMLTTVAAGRDQDPAWTPTGDRILFDASFPPGIADDAGVTSYNVFSMDPGGGSILQLTHEPSGLFAGDPAVSPDGTRIAFGQGGGSNPPKGGIFLMNADGSNVVRVTTPPASATDGDGFPSFSPDGTKLVFVRDGAVYIVGVDGKGLRRVTAPLFALRPRWSPNGSKIIFGHADNATAAGIARNVSVVNADGRG